MRLSILLRSWVSANVRAFPLTGEGLSLRLSRLLRIWVTAIVRAFPLDGGRWHGEAVTDEGETNRYFYFT